MTISLNNKLLGIDVKPAHMTRSSGLLHEIAFIFRKCGRMFPHSSGKCGVTYNYSVATNRNPVRQ